MTYIAPAGTPIRASQVYEWLHSIFGNKNIVSKFAEKIKNDIGVKHCIFISSGRTALYLLLKYLFELREEKNRNQVVIPSYTCFSVPGSVIKAGLQIRICDVDPRTLSYDKKKLAQFDFSNVLAIVSANLYGIPDDLLEIEKIAKQNGVFLVDDAAQCLGGSVSGKASGSFGDAGIFSFDKGKNITSIQGGVIVTNSDDIAFRLSQEIERLPQQKSTAVLADCVKLAAYAFMLRPSLYWMVTKMPFTKLGSTPFTTDYPVHQYSPVMAAMATVLYDQLPTFTQQRTRNAREIINSLTDIPWVHPIIYPDYVRPVFLRLPMFATDKHKRDEIISLLNKNGVGATASYPSTVTEIPAIQHLLFDEDRNMANGKKVADSIITLPTHPYVTPSHIETIQTQFHRL